MSIGDRHCQHPQRQPYEKDTQTFDNATINLLGNYESVEYDAAGLAGDTLLGSGRQRHH
jgi:hypothetical protein